MNYENATEAELQRELVRLVGKFIDFDGPQLDTLAALRAAKAGPCRHTSDHDGTTCPLCIALAELEKQA